MPSGLLSYSSDIYHQLAPARHRGRRSVCERVLEIWLSISSKRCFLFLLFLCIMGYVTVYFFITDNVVIDRKFAEAVPAEVEEARHDFHRVRIARKCSKKTSRCYSVYDCNVVDTGEKPYVRRELLIDGTNGDVDTVAVLIPPRPDEAFESSDTRMWSVCSWCIDSHYVTAIAIAPFVFGVLPLQETPAQAATRPPRQILLIGLGGGSLDMFWLQLNRNMNMTVLELEEEVVQLAHDWFGVREERLRRTVIGDGVDFIRSAAAEENMKYDVVVVDACDLDSALPCPAAPFLREETIRDASSILARDGIFVVNVLSSDGKESGIQKVSAALSAHFGSCFRLSVSVEDNVVVVCSPKTAPDSAALSHFYFSRIEAAIKTFKLKQVVTASGSLSQRHGQL